MILAIGVLLGIGFPSLAQAVRPLMSAAIFLIVLGTLLRIEIPDVLAALKRPSLSIFLPVVVMVVSPVFVGIVGHTFSLNGELSLVLVLAVSAPPSSGTAAVARMLGLNGAVPLVVTFLSMALAPLTIPLLAAWFGGLDIDPLDLALRLALLIGSAECAALLLRRFAAPIVAARAGITDVVIVGALLVFALATMAGVRDQISTMPNTAVQCVILAFACNIGLQAVGILLLPGSLRERLTVGLILGNRNVGLVWSALGAGVSPRMALFFAAAQLPIYTLPRFLEWLITQIDAGTASQRVSLCRNVPKDLP